MKSARAFALSGVALAALMSNVAVAQDVNGAADAANATGTATTTSAPAPGGIGDIVVTARREAEVAQSVPVTLTAFDAESLREANITNVTNLMNATPGISTRGTGSDLNTFYSIRGVSRQITGTGQAGVVAYFAEVPLPASASNVPFFDMANVQVLKGPQGTLFGRNTVGGALLFEPATPTNEFAGYINGKVQNYDGYALEAAVNAPIVEDKVSIRIAGLYDRQDGYTRNLGSAGPRRLGGYEERAIRGTLRIEPSDTFKNITIVDYDKYTTSTPSVLLRGPTAAGQAQLLAIGAQVNPANPAFIVNTLNAEAASLAINGPRVTNSGLSSPRETAERWGVINRTEVQLSDAISLINVLGYRSVDYFANVNLDGSSLPVVEGLGRSFAFEQVSEELQIHANFMDDKIRVIAGGFYLKSKPKRGNVNAVSILFQPNPQYTWQTDTSKAVFANVSVKLDEVVEGLRFSAGYRHTWDKQSICAGGAIQGPGAVPGVASAPYTALGADDCDASTPGLSNVGGSSSKSDAPGWTVGLDWQASRSLFLYAVSRRGYRSGGLNPPTLGPALAPFQSYDPETNTDVEIGLKSDWRVGGVVGRFNLSGFYSWQKDVQIAFTGISQPRTVCVGGVAPVWIDGDCNVANNPNSGALTLNAGDTKVKGVEAELVIKPVPELTLSALGTLLDPSISRGEIPAAPVGSVVAPTGAFPFNQILNQNLAKRSLSASARFDLPLDESVGEVTLSANFFITSKTPVNALVIPGYDETSARIDWKNFLGSTVDLGLFAQNLFDQDNLVAASFSPIAFAPFLVAGVYNRPRTYGFEARIHW